MKTPNLNRRITIQSQTTTQDSYGQEQQTWSPVYECWAEIDIVQSQLIWSTAEFISKTTHRITIRWTPTPDIQPNMQIVFVEPYTNVSHTYEIQTIVNPKQGNFWMVLLAYELNASE
jgi:SPP1 family predicted phage head-tail adaptor